MGDGVGVRSRSGGDGMRGCRVLEWTFFLMI